MPYCETVRMPGGGTAVVRFGGKRPTCVGCGSPNVHTRCDGPAPSPRRKTCDAWLCDKCKLHVDPDLDFCQAHRSMAYVRCSECGVARVNHGYQPGPYFHEWIAEAKV